MLYVFNPLYLYVFNHLSTYAYTMRMLLYVFNPLYSIICNILLGVFEQYARSLKLFHAMAGAHTEPSDVELFPVRTANEHRKAYLHQHFQYSDPWDSALHARAQQIFEEELSYVSRKYATHI
jgi:hypothetical protein